MPTPWFIASIIFSCKKLLNHICLEAKAETGRNHPRWFGVPHMLRKNRRRCGFGITICAMRGWLRRVEPKLHLGYREELAGRKGEEAIYSDLRAKSFTWRKSWGKVGLWKKHRLGWNPLCQAFADRMLIIIWKPILEVLTGDHATMSHGCQFFLRGFDRWRYRGRFPPNRIESILLKK